MKQFKLISIILLITSLFGCAFKKPQVLDGPGMEYNDREYRTEYANTLDFDSQDRNVKWAVAFLGYGEDGENNLIHYFNKLFSELPAESVNAINHYNFEGDEWYLVIPRYKGMNEIVSVTDEKISAYSYKGEAFTVKCNISDIHSNIRIRLVDSGEEFSPQVDGTGQLVSAEEVWDITEYN
mgnify:FL=1